MISPVFICHYVPNVDSRCHHFAAFFFARIWLSQGGHQSADITLPITGPDIISRASRAKPFRRVLGWLLVLPFVMFATIGQGTMIDTGPDGPRVVLCTEAGMVEMVMSGDGALTPAGDDRQDHSGDVACDWALHGQSALTAAAATGAAPVLLELAAEYSLHIPLHDWRAEVLTPAARGPPALI